MHKYFIAFQCSLKKIKFTKSYDIKLKRNSLQAEGHAHSSIPQLRPQLEGKPQATSVIVADIQIKNRTRDHSNATQ